MGFREATALSSLAAVVAADVCHPWDFQHGRGTQGGTKISEQSVGSAGECCAACDEEAQCAFWTFVPEESTCKLKSGDVTWWDDPEAQSYTSGGAAGPAPPPAPTPSGCDPSGYQHGRGTQGGTKISEVSVGSADECCAACDDVQCTAWTFVPEESSCKLKSGDVTWWDDQQAQSYTSGGGARDRGEVHCTCDDPGEIEGWTCDNDDYSGECPEGKEGQKVCKPSGEWNLPETQDDPAWDHICHDHHSPSPGPLPDIPKVDTWVGFWGATKETDDIFSLAFDNSGDPYTADQINKRGGGGLRFLYPAFMFFCEEQAMSNTCSLMDDYKEKWEKAVPEMEQLLKDGKIIGFTVGDERVCSHGKHGTSVEDLTKMIDTIRGSFPDRNKAIIHYNECGGTFGEGDDCEDAAMDDVPSGLDWINIDVYRKDNTDDEFMDDLKEYYEKCIYTKMHSHQQICITPGSTSEVCPNEETCLDDAKYTVDWAESDDKVACIQVYRWDEMDQIDDGEWSDLKDYWTEYARQSRPEMQNAAVV